MNFNILYFFLGVIVTTILQVITTIWKLKSIDKILDKKLKIFEEDMKIK